MKIIYSWGHRKGFQPSIEAYIKDWVSAGYDITSINHREPLGIERAWSFQELNEFYTNKDETLCKFYAKIVDLAETHDVFMVESENIYHPEFIKTLKNKHIYTVIVSGDDPESSENCSKPYVHAFNHSFCNGVNFDKDTRLTDKFLEWGAKRADWWPYGLVHDMNTPSLTEEDIYNEERDVDLVYVSSYWHQRLERLTKIKKAFPQVNIYGRGWNFKRVLINALSISKQKRSISLLRDVLLHGMWQIKELPEDKLAQLYRRCKIGINMHLSFGPCNLRMYQLPANGVMQICDCPEGIGQVFEIGKEVVVYHSIEEAIELIKYYLEHDDERKKIAAAGFRRVMQDYRRLQTFSRAMAKVKEGMLEDGIRHFKDGTPITTE